MPRTKALRRKRHRALGVTPLTPQLGEHLHGADRHRRQCCARPLPRRPRRPRNRRTRSPARGQDGALEPQAADGVPLPRARKPERYLTHGQVAALADEAGEARPVVLVLAYCGLRFGELAALRVRRVDLMRRRLEVAEAVTEVAGTAVWGRRSRTSGGQSRSLGRSRRNCSRCWRGRDPMTSCSPHRTAASCGSTTSDGGMGSTQPPSAPGSRD